MNTKEITLHVLDRSVLRLGIGYIFEAYRLDDQIVGIFEIHEEENIPIRFYTSITDGNTETGDRQSNYIGSVDCDQVDQLFTDLLHFMYDTIWQDQHPKTFMATQQVLDHIVRCTEAQFVENGLTYASNGTVYHIMPTD